MIDVTKARALWFQLHHAKSFNQGQQKAFLEKWLTQVETVLGCATCFKKVQWFMTKWPVDYGKGFHLWGLCLHDFVNKDLGRNLFYPEFTIAPLTARGIIQ